MSMDVARSTQLLRFTSAFALIRYSWILELYKGPWIFLGDFPSKYRNFVCNCFSHRRCLISIHKYWSDRIILISEDYVTLLDFTYVIEAIHTSICCWTLLFAVVVAPRYLHNSTLPSCMYLCIVIFWPINSISSILFI